MFFITRMLCVCALVALPMALQARAEITLVANGKTDYGIILGANETETTAYAVAELQRWVKEMTGVEIPFVKHANDETPGMKRLVLFEVPPTTAYKGKAIGSDGYYYEVGDSGELHVYGGSQRGILYAVYGLLEDQWGCKWFTPTVSSIPRRDTLTLPDRIPGYVPPLEYREPFTFESFDGDWTARNRCNSQAARLEARHGGKIQYNGFVHTFDGLVPPTQYFAEHPEYFAEVNGKRLGEHTQLCCTNPDVVRLVTEGILKRIEETPEATVFSVSQNDWYYYCECAKCAAVAKREDSQIGPVLEMVNTVARAVAQKHPDKLIDTLAYQWTRKPPKHLRPEPNVIVRLCSIECCFSHAFTKCDSPLNKDFVRDVKAWAKICDRLWVWDYVTTFASYLAPFPNLRVRQDNIEFFVKHNVTGIFEQDVYNTPGGEFSELSGYLGAKLLWNPKYDPEKAINEFLHGVYGDAAAPIRRYLDALHDKVERENLHVGIWATPEAVYLTPDLMAFADQCFDEAEKAVAADPAILQRVQIARMSTDYVQIEHTRHDADRIGVMDHDNLIIRPNAEFATRVSRFLAAGKASGITQLREQAQPYADYAAQLPEMLNEKPLPLQAATDASGALPGLRMGYFPGQFTAVKDLSNREPSRSSVVDAVSLEVAGETDAVFGLVFRGHFKAERQGIYTFHLTSNDGAVLYLGGQKLINSDGDHRTLTKSGQVALAPGLHPIAIRYFQAGGEKALALAYQGPGIAKQPVPASALWHQANDTNRADSMEP